jgi:hypothetical protein
MFDEIRLAMSSSTSSGTCRFSWVDFLRRIARRVSRSGGWTSVMRPHSKRVRRRSSSWPICLGGRSEEITICFSALCRALKVWKNSSWVRSLVEELDVVDEEDVDVAVAALERDLAPVGDRVDELVGELLGGDVADLEPGDTGWSRSDRRPGGGGSCRARRPP